MRDDVTELELTPTLPLGMVIKGRTSEPAALPFRLDADQALVLYSDGSGSVVRDDATLLIVRSDRAGRGLLAER